MNNAEILKTFAIFSFIAILFSPINSKIWMLFFGFGLIFGILWFFKRE